MTTMFRSATFKLTMWYLALVMGISLIFSVTLYKVATGELRRGLGHETQRIYSQFPVFQNNPLLRTGVDYDSGAHRILLRLVGFNLIVLVGAGFASYWLARRTLEPIAAAHEQQQRFTADVSHELRTPLTALKMESEVALLGKSSKDELRQTLRSNLEEASKIEGLINNLLRLTQLESGELQQAFKATDSKKLAQAAVAQVQALADSHDIKLLQKVEPASVEGDQDSLMQLLVILLDNAIKYSPAGTSVTLSGRRHGNEVVLSVKDQGQGIKPSALEHVFDRFYRADSSRSKTDAGGYGLGLSIAKMIADLHNGSITLASQLGHGTTATIRLPAVQSEVGSPPAKPSRLSV